MLSDLAAVQVQSLLCYGTESTEKQSTNTYQPMVVDLSFDGHRFFA